MKPMTPRCIVALSLVACAALSPAAADEGAESMHALANALLDTAIFTPGEETTQIMLDPVVEMLLPIVMMSYRGDANTARDVLRRELHNSSISGVQQQVRPMALDTLLQQMDRAAMAGTLNFLGTEDGRALIRAIEAIEPAMARESLARGEDAAKEAMERTARILAGD